MDFLQSFFASNNKITNTEQLMLYNPSLFSLNQESLYKEKTIIYPNSFKFTDTIKFSNM